MGQVQLNLNKDVMKQIIFFCVIILSVSKAKSQGTDADSLRNVAVSTIRIFRNEISKYDKKQASSTDKLKKTVSTLLNITKSVTNESQLKTISKYFSLQTEILKDTSAFTDTDELDSTMSGINDDLRYKMSMNHVEGLQIGEKFSFGNEKQIIVNGLIDGKEIDGQGYRLYWANFRGRPLGYLMRNNSYSGLSSNLSSPFKINIILPANFIAFWLIDTKTEKLYQPDFQYMNSIGIKSKMDVDFKLLR